MTRTANVFSGNLMRLMKDRSGVSAVGFAMIFPVLVATVLGLFHIGVAFFGLQQAQATTDLIARTAFTMNDPSAEEIKALIAEQLGTTVGGSFTPNVVLLEKYGATYADVQIQYSYTPVIPLVPEVTFQSTASTEVLIRNLD